ncbi:glycosyltransferase [Rossellomorea aquimaris]|uniref:Glycosyltransferase involved in cell wall biosynthesis n=1 Tax=Rossellomorea aquimaris TaxID=189382 RepID=A0A366EMF0_9BACI|nr:glycosyltransferase [Rossellomorea aquimaris]RBP03156.1 glycosyltransferase involved in cell wall biosynthesis [Rossellomorea aquimaris]
MKKILIMATNMNVGGVEKSLLSLLSEVPKGKYDITLYLLEKKGGFLDFIPSWIRVIEVDWYKKIKPIIMQSPHQIVKNYYLNNEIKRIPGFISTYFISKKTDNRYFYYKHVFNQIPFNADEFDIAISYQGPTDIIDYYIVKKVKAKKKIAWIHFDVAKHNINQKLYEKLHCNFNKIYVVSEEARKNLLEKFPNNKEKSEVFLNIISSNYISEMAKERINFDKNYKGLKIVTVGRLSLEKGQDLAIKVLQKLKEEGYKVKWYCIGEGRDRGLFEGMIDKYDLKNDFILLGAKANPYPYIAAADIYVQTSRHEGYCLSLAEARSLNRPIVTTQFTGVSEQIINKYNGLISTFNEEEMYMKIKSLLDNNEKRNFLSKNLEGDNLDTISEINKLFNYID